MNLTFVDIIVLIVMVVLALLGLKHGFTRKIVSMLAWVGATIAALWGFQPLGDWLSNYLPLWFAYVTAAFAIFIVVLSGVLSLGYAVSMGLSVSPVGILDRGLGLLFGLAQGLVLVSILYLAFLWYADKDDPPPGWITQARLLPVVESVSLLLWKGAIAISSVDEIWPELRFDPSVLPGLAPETPAEPDEQNTEGSGYDETDRKDIDRLFNSFQGEG